MAQSKRYRVKIQEIQEIAKHTYFVVVEKPEGFEYQAGQFTILSLIDKGTQDPKGNFRYFSVATAPYEDGVGFVFRKSESIFKEALLRMKPGDEVEISDPLGKFVLPEETDKEIVFLTGGVGITPVRSIIRQALHDKTKHTMCLFYSNFTPEETAFFEELTKIDVPTHRVVCTMTGMDHAKMPWEGETCYIDWEMLTKYLDDPMNKHYFIVGPPGFIKAMREMLQEHEVASEDITLESFGGY